MRLVSLLPLLFVFGDGDARMDAELFQGTWRVLEYHNDGSALPQDKVKTMSVIIKKDKMTITLAAEKRRDTYTFTLDPKQSPKAINVGVPQKKGFEFLGIYEVKGNTLRIGLTLKGARPKEFPTKPMRDHTFLVLERDSK